MAQEFYKSVIRVLQECPLPPCQVLQELEWEQAMRQQLQQKGQVGGAGAQVSAPPFEALYLPRAPFHPPFGQAQVGVCWWFPSAEAAVPHLETCCLPSAPFHPPLGQVQVGVCWWFPSAEASIPRFKALYLPRAPFHPRLSVHG